jgi:hypothetical protein
MTIHESLNDIDETARKLAKELECDGLGLQALDCVRIVDAVAEIRRVLGIGLRAAA